MLEVEVESSMTRSSCERGRDDDDIRSGRAKPFEKEELRRKRRGGFTVDHAAGRVVMSEVECERVGVPFVAIVAETVCVNQVGASESFSVSVSASDTSSHRRFLKAANEANRASSRVCASRASGPCNVGDCARDGTGVASVLRAGFASSKRARVDGSIDM